MKDEAKAGYSVDDFANKFQGFHLTRGDEEMTNWDAQAVNAVKHPSEVAGTPVQNRIRQTDVREQHDAW